MKYTISICLLLLVGLNILAQDDCPEEDVFFNSQADIDEFIANYPNCEHLNGHLYFRNNEFTPDLSFFNQIISIEKDLVFDYMDNVLAIEGFNNLEQCRALKFEGCPKLETILGFEKLAILEGDLLFTNLIDLDVLPDFAALTYIGDDLRISGCNSLTEISSFNNLETVERDLTIYFNEGVQFVGGFDELINVNKITVSGGAFMLEMNAFNNLEETPEVIVEHNHSLLFLGGFDKLKDIQSLILRNNSSLVNISSFDKIVTLSKFWVLSNQKLQDISFLSGIQYWSGADIRINDNIELNDCCILNEWQFENGTAFNGIDQFYIENNGENCSSFDGIGTICGCIFYPDVDGDGLGDPSYIEYNCVTELEGFVTNNLDDCDGAYDECDRCNGSGIPPQYCDCNFSTFATQYFLDLDGDGLGNPNLRFFTCEDEIPEGFVFNNDDDCDGFFDQCGICNGNSIITPSCDCFELVTWFADLDGDGLGNPLIQVNSCSEPEGYVLNSNDDDEGIFSNDSELSVTSIEIYPNPTSETLNISFEKTTNSNVKYEIYNNLGELVAFITIQNTDKIHTLNIHHLKQGLYYVNIQYDREFITKRIVIF